MSETTKDGTGRSWTLRGKTMRDMSVFTEQVSNLKKMGVDLAPDLFGQMADLINGGAAGSVLALTAVAPQFLHVDRMACLIRSVADPGEALDAQLESRIEKWPVDECQVIVNHLLPFFLTRWSEAYLGSLTTMGGFAERVEAMTAGLKDGELNLTNTSASPLNSSGSAAAATSA